MVRAIKNMLARIRNGRAYREAAEARALALAQAEQHRRSALAAVSDAKARNDSRDLGAAYKRARAATHQELRLGMRR